MPPSSSALPPQTGPRRAAESRLAVPLRPSPPLQLKSRLESATSLSAAANWPQISCWPVYFTAACPHLPLSPRQHFTPGPSSSAPLTPAYPRRAAQLLFYNTACFQPSNPPPLSGSSPSSSGLLLPSRRLASGVLLTQPVNAAYPLCQHPTLAPAPLAPPQTACRGRGGGGGGGGGARWWVSTRFLPARSTVASCNAERFRQLLEAVCCSTKARDRAAGGATLALRQAERC